MKCQTQLESMANEDASINSLNQRKPRTEQTRKQQNEHTRNKEVPSKECHKFDVNMATRNVTQKESDVTSAKS